jgi:hypothetical protein
MKDGSVTFSRRWKSLKDEKSRKLLFREGGGEGLRFVDERLLQRR